MNRLPLRDDVDAVEYHRPPTEAETRFGYGAIHYATFAPEECCFEGTRVPKKWFVSERDGLRYYR